MLMDISNNVNVHNGSHHNLRPLKIVKRTQNNNFNIRSNNENINPHILHQKITQTKMETTDTNPMKMADEPSYRFNRIFQSTADMVDPFYQYPFINNSNNNYYSKKNNNNELKLDFTNDITFFKNVVKKYSKPINIKYIEQIPYQVKSSSAKKTIFNSNLPVDPLMGCFIHSKNENTLRFSDFLMTVAQDGTSTMEYSPNPILKYDKQFNNNNYNNNIADEILYQSDEGENSRLENSDLDATDDDDDDDNDSDMDLDLDLNDQNCSIINSSMINDLPPTSISNPTLSSPKKKNNPSSPLKQELLFRTLKNKTSPMKDLTSQRFGHNLSQIKKPKVKSTKNSHTNYAKFDNSMTISAKAIMRMVDDSLVSSDTELYNNSLSFLKTSGKVNSNNYKNTFSNFNINATDLISALNDEAPNYIEDPLVVKLKDLKL
jgi:hypothetical protein